jgi:hypothetical protein
MKNRAASPPAPCLFVKRKDRRNTVLNWHRAPEEEFDIYAGVYWNAAQTLVKNLELDRIFGYDACPVVFLYRHALELFLKAILLGDGANFLRNRPDPKWVMDHSHSLKELIPHVREILERFAREGEFGRNEVRTFDDFEALVGELDNVDKNSCAFRYPVDKKLQGTVPGHFTFNAGNFARKMDDALNTLSGACSMLPELWQAECEAAYQASNNADNVEG